MAIPTRSAIPGTYFITAATYNRRRLFQVPANAELLLQTLQHYRREGDYKLHAFVVMPDQIHLLLTPTETLERAMQLIKGGFSHQLASKLPAWQRSFTDHRIRDREDFNTRLHYIQQTQSEHTSSKPPSSTHTPPHIVPFDSHSNVSLIPDPLRATLQECCRPVLLRARLQPCRKSLAGNTALAAKVRFCCRTPFLRSLFSRAISASFATQLLAAEIHFRLQMPHQTNAKDTWRTSSHHPAILKI